MDGSGFATLVGEWFPQFRPNGNCPGLCKRLDGAAKDLATRRQHRLSCDRDESIWNCGNDVADNQREWLDVSSGYNPPRPNGRVGNSGNSIDVLRRAFERSSASR